MKITRRAALKVTAQATAGSLFVDPSYLFAQTSQFDALVAGQYTGGIQLRVAGGGYLGANFQLSSAPYIWCLELGRYQGLYGHTPEDLHGYWIYRKDAYQAWQAFNLGGGPLRYWNANGQAVGNPEDWELFTFQTVDRGTGSVRVFNTGYGPRSTSNGSFSDGSNQPCFIGLVGNSFNCDAVPASAVIFHVDLLGYLPHVGRPSPQPPHVQGPPPWKQPH